MLSCLGSAQQPLNTFGFQLFVGSPKCLNISTIGFGLFLEQTILIVCHPGMVTRHHIIFREIFYFRAVSNDILFMISWTFVLTSVRTPTRAEKFHKQIATAKDILQGEFMKLNGTK